MAYSRSQLPRVAKALRVGSLTRGLSPSLRQSARQSAAQVEALMRAFSKPKGVTMPPMRGSAAGGGPVTAETGFGPRQQV